MSAHARLAFSAATAFAISLSLPFGSPIAANAAETCLEAPKGVAPAGNHWKYRLERGTQRKCWRLVQVERKAAPVLAEPQGDDDEEATPAPAAPAPVAKRAVKSTEISNAEPAPSPPAPVIRELVTRKVSNPSDAAQPFSPPQPSVVAQTDTTPAPAERQQAPREEVAPAVTAPAVLIQQPAAANQSVEGADAGATPTLRLLLGAVALLGLLACGAFLFAEMMRRRTDVLNTIRYPEDEPAEEFGQEGLPEASPKLEADDTPTFAPIPPMAAMTRHDDLEESLRQLTRRVRRRAA
jgi:hypothetical protein